VKVNQMQDRNKYQMPVTYLRERMACNAQSAAGQLLAFAMTDYQVMSVLLCTAL